MSEINGIPVPQQNVPVTPELVQRVFQGNVQMQGQIKFLENRLRELMPKPQDPIYPTTQMPDAPVVTSVPPPLPEFKPAGDGENDAMPDPTTSMTLPPPEGKLRIMIGIPMLAVSYEFFESFLKFWTALVTLPGRDYEIMYHFAYRRPVHMAEEYLVKTAQANKCTHILLMDDDIFDITPRDLQLLIEAKKEFISGVMHASKFPHAMCVFRRYDASKRVIDMPADKSMYRLYEVPANCPECKAPQTHWDVHFCPNCGKEIDIEIQEADLTPFPFTLIDLKVFDKVKQPWFHCTNGYPTDSWFCDRLMEAGIKPHAHMLVRLNHAGVTDETKPYFVQMGMAKMNKTKAVVILAPEQMDIHQNLLVNRMNEVENQIKPKPPVIGEGNVIVTNKPTNDLTLVTAQAR